MVPGLQGLHVPDSFLHLNGLKPIYGHLGSSFWQGGSSTWLATFWQGAGFNCTTSCWQGVSGAEVESGLLLLDLSQSGPLLLLLLLGGFFLLWQGEDAAAPEDAAVPGSFWQAMLCPLGRAAVWHPFDNAPCPAHQFSPGSFWPGDLWGFHLPPSLPQIPPPSLLSSPFSSLPSFPLPSPFLFPSPFSFLPPPFPSLFLSLFPALHSPALVFLLQLPWPGLWLSSCLFWLVWWCQTQQVFPCCCSHPTYVSLSFPLAKGVYPWPRVSSNRIWLTDLFWQEDCGKVEKALWARSQGLSSKTAAEKHTSHTRTHVNPFCQKHRQPSKHDLIEKLWLSSANNINLKFIYQQYYYQWT